MRKLALYGAGDLGLEVLELYKHCNAADSRYDEVFFVDDDSGVRASASASMRVVGFEGLVEQAAVSSVEVTICVGDPCVRALLAEKVRGAGIGLATLVHPSVEVPESASFGEGCIVYPGTYVGPNAHVGANTLVIRGALAHDCSVGRDCVLSTGAILSGHDVVGDQTFIGAATAVKEGVTIGSHVIMGMGSMVFRDVEDGLVVLGNPARPMRRNDDQRVFG